MSTPETLSLRDIEILFQPFHHRKISLSSRIVMAPMTRNFAPNGVPTLEMAHYYRRRAQQELGLIITESTVIDDPAAAADSDTPHFYGGSALRAWKSICTAVHATNCKMIPQLCHVGMARPIDGTAPNPDQPPVGPSGIDPITLQQTAPPMSLSRIAAVIASYARAAAYAKTLGFDGVEIQGAHACLIDQFLWEKTNQRSDEYGGDLIRRTRFAREVIQAVRKAVGRHFPILFRFSQWKPEHYDARLANTPTQLATLLTPLSDAGVDIFDCSTRSFSAPEFEGSALSLAGWVHQLTGKPTIAVGSVGLSREFTPSETYSPLSVPASNITRLLQMMQAGEFDLVAIGRALLADPAWAYKQHLGQETSISPFSHRILGRLF